MKLNKYDIDFIIHISLDLVFFSYKFLFICIILFILY